MNKTSNKLHITVTILLSLLFALAAVFVPVSFNRANNNSAYAQQGMANTANRIRHVVRTNLISFNNLAPTNSIGTVTNPRPSDYNMRNRGPENANQGAAIAYTNFYRDTRQGGTNTYRNNHTSLQAFVAVGGDLQLAITQGRITNLTVDVGFAIGNLISNNTWMGAATFFDICYNPITAPATFNRQNNSMAMNITSPWISTPGQIYATNRNLAVGAAIQTGTGSGNGQARAWGVTRALDGAANQNSWAFNTRHVNLTPHINRIATQGGFWVRMWSYAAAWQNTISETRWHQTAITLEGVRLNASIERRVPQNIASTNFNSVYGDALTSLQSYVPRGVFSSLSSGSFNWHNPAQNVGSVGLNYFYANFVPSNLYAYYTVPNIRTYISVAQATPTPSLPTNLVATEGDYLHSIALPDNWSWANGDVLLSNTGYNNFAAIYTPTNLNFHSVTHNLAVYVQICLAAMQAEAAAINALIAALYGYTNHTALQSAISSIDNRIATWNSIADNVALYGINSAALNIQRERAAELLASYNAQNAMAAEVIAINAQIAQLAQISDIEALQTAIAAAEQRIANWDGMALVGVNFEEIANQQTRLAELIAHAQAVAQMQAEAVAINELIVALSAIDTLEELSSAIEVVEQRIYNWGGAVALIGIARLELNYHIGRLSVLLQLAAEAAALAAMQAEVAVINELIAQLCDYDTSAQLKFAIDAIFARVQNWIENGNGLELQGIYEYELFYHVGRAYLLYQEEAHAAAEAAMQAEVARINALIDSLYAIAYAYELEYAINQILNYINIWQCPQGLDIVPYVNDYELQTQIERLEELQYVPYVPCDTTPCEPCDSSPYEPCDTAPYEPCDTSPVEPCDTTPYEPCDTSPYEPCESSPYVPCEPCDTTPCEPPCETSPYEPCDTTPYEPCDTTPYEPCESSPYEPYEPCETSPYAPCDSTPVEPCDSAPCDSSPYEPCDTTPYVPCESSPYVPCDTTPYEPPCETSPYAPCYTSPYEPSETSPYIPYKPCETTPYKPCDSSPYEPCESSPYKPCEPCDTTPYEPRETTPAEPCDTATTELPGQEPEQSTELPPVQQPPLPPEPPEPQPQPSSPPYDYEYEYGYYYEPTPPTRPGFGGCGGAAGTNVGFMALMGVSLTGAVAIPKIKKKNKSKKSS